MVGAGSAVKLHAGLGLFLVKRRSLDRATWFHKVAIGAVVLPYVANSAGWIFTEMGRQPWAVQGLLLTEDAVSPGTTAGEVAVSLVGFAALYSVLGYAMVKLFVKLAKKGPDELPPDHDVPGMRDIALTY
jgi:cytochrome d ubiquinol oxidase subunit I